MNISRNEISGLCNLKCSYNFKYTTSACKVTNRIKRGDQLVLMYDKKNVAPVIFNGNEYDVSYVGISILPWVKIRNKIPPAFLVVRHLPRVEGSELIVIVPIIPGGTSSAGNLVSKIIDSTFKEAPSYNDKSSLNINDFSLEHLVPKKPFFSSATAASNIIVYDTDYAISLNEKYIDQMYFARWPKLNKNTIGKWKKKVANGAPHLAKSALYFNANGPNSNKRNVAGESSDNVYIDCQPVNADEDDTEVKMDGYSGGSGENWFAQEKVLAFFKNPWVQAVLLFFAIVIVYVVVTKLLKFVAAKGSTDGNT